MTNVTMLQATATTIGVARTNAGGYNTTMPTLQAMAGNTEANWRRGWLPTSNSDNGGLWYRIYHHTLP